MPNPSDSAASSPEVADRAYHIMREVEDHHWWFDGMETITQRMLDATAGATGQGRTVLDAGCGTGRNLGFLTRYGEVTGMDFSPVALESCRERGFLRLHLGSVNELPFAPRSFDLVTSFDVLTNRTVVDTTALAEFVRVTRPGGTVLVRVAAYDWLRGRHDEEWNVGHRFERGELRAKFERAGLEVRLASYANMFLFPAVLLKRQLERVFPPKAGTSDLQVGASRSLTTRVLGTLLASEARWAARPAGLPFGLSLCVVGRKPA